MKSNYNRNRKIWILEYVVICVTVIIAMFILNQKTIFTSDDYMFHFFSSSRKVNDATRLLNGAGDLPASLWNHYNRFNGRLVAHTLLQLFTLFDKNVFDVCNSCVFLLGGFLLLGHIQPDRHKWKPIYLGTVYLCMWLLFPHFGLAVFWFSGAFNYLWTTVMILGFLLPYYSYTAKVQDMGEHMIWKSLMMIPLGLIAGCTNENSGGAAVLMAGLVLVNWIWQKKVVPLWGVSGIISVCVGFLCLLCAPSTASRMGSVPITMEVILKRVREIAGFSYHYLLLLYVVFLVTAILYIRLKKKLGKEWITGLVVPCCYVFAGAASVIVLIASPIIMGKSWIWAVCFTIIAIGQLLVQMTEDGYVIDRKIKLAVGAAAIYGVIWYGIVWQDMDRTYQEYKVQIQQIQEQKEAGIMDVTVSLLTPTTNLYNPLSKTINVSEHASDWFNEWMALYYGVDSITGVEQ